MTEVELGRKIGRRYEVHRSEGYDNYIPKRSNDDFPDEFAIQPNWRRTIWVELTWERRRRDKAMGTNAKTPEIPTTQIPWMKRRN